MEYRNLGNSGLQVSVVGLGCNNLGRQVDADGAAAIVNKCVELGVTFFDGADVYGAPRGHSEEVLGQALKPHRRNVVLATKSAVPMGEGPYWGGASRRYLMDALDACLRRLDTDYIDLYQMHFPDPKTPIEETLRAMDDMVHSGKVRYIGCGTYSASQIVEASFVAKLEHLTPFVSANNRYNMLERDIEKDFVPACVKYGLGILPYYPLAAGLLTGKYRLGGPVPEGTRLTSGIRFYDGYLSDTNLEKVEKLIGFAEARGRTMLELAIGWLASKPYIPCVMTGAVQPDQIEQNVKSSEWRLTQAEMDEIDVLMGVTSS